MGIFDFFRSPPTIEKFAQLVIQEFTAAGNSSQLRYDAAECRLLGDGEGVQIINLENGFRDYCAAPRKQRQQVLQHFVQGLTAPPLPISFAEARASVLPVIRGRGTLEYLRLLPETLAGSKAKPYGEAFAPFSDDSVIMLALDSERSIQTLTGSVLEGWGVSFDEVLAAAIDNLRDMSVASFQQVVPGVFMASWNDNYETSRLLFSDLFYQLGVGGEPVAMAPTRNKLLVASANDETGLIAMLALARSLVEDEGRQVSALMYRFEQGKPVEFVPVQPEVLRLATELKKILLLNDYQMQKEMLDKLNQKAQLDLFVASYKLVQSEATGRVHSYGVWTDQVDTLLPEVDKVALVRYHEESGEPDVRVVEWEELRSHIKELQHAVAGYPVRYHLPTFPSRELLESLTCVEMNA
ncbi:MULTISPECIES: DUF1444 family protein [unclassified Duganella]|uniref:DUF1444 family protein n=1 Tax=unclassified Duganella TaxID=2636909 RepID=UPI00088E7FD5|nr:MULTISPECIES: DUF1444 family protein [unclassified Duganella]SDH54434.1 Uncharacterized protein YtpQ, UPF0354 family [Duganella sp. OV458]SDK68556.1 Uncharacterized protein YtpQ, UPF0354 family [Duganella sp. OV510]